MYGNHAGALVTEQSETRGLSSSTQKRLQAELAWASIAAVVHAPLDILRLGGIYGFERNSFISFLRDPHRLRKLGGTLDLPVSVVHVEDVVAAVDAAMQRKRGGGVELFNIVDDSQGTKRMMYECALRIMEERGVARGVEHAAQGDRKSSLKRSRIRADNRVSNAKMKKSLLPQLKYPTYREGFHALAEQLFPFKSL